MFYVFRPPLLAWMRLLGDDLKSIWSEVISSWTRNNQQHEHDARWEWINNSVNGNPYNRIISCDRKAEMLQNNDKAGWSTKNGEPRSRPIGWLSTLPCVVPRHSVSSVCHLLPGCNQVQSSSNIHDSRPTALGMSGFFETFIQTVRKAVVHSETSSTTISHIIHHSDLLSEGVLVVDLDSARPFISVCCRSNSSDGHCAIWKSAINDETMKSQVSNKHDDTETSNSNIIFIDPRPGVWSLLASNAFTTLCHLLFTFVTNMSTF